MARGDFLNKRITFSRCLVAVVSRRRPNWRTYHNSQIILRHIVSINLKRRVKSWRKSPLNFNFLPFDGSDDSLRVLRTISLQFDSNFICNFSCFLQTIGVLSEPLGPGQTGSPFCRCECVENWSFKFKNVAYVTAGSTWEGGRGGGGRGGGRKICEQRFF